MPPPSDGRTADNPLAYPAVQLAAAPSPGELYPQVAMRTLGNAAALVGLYGAVGTDAVFAAMTDPVGRLTHLGLVVASIPAATNGLTDTADGPVPTTSDEPDQADLGLDAIAKDPAPAADRSTESRIDGPEQADEELDMVTTEKPSGQTDLTDGNKVNPGRAPTTNPTEDTIGADMDDHEPSEAKTSDANPGFAETGGNVDNANPGSDSGP